MIQLPRFTSISPHEYLERLYADPDFELSPTDDDQRVLDAIEFHGTFKTADQGRISQYAERVLNSHRLARFQAETGHPF